MRWQKAVFDLMPSGECPPWFSAQPAKQNVSCQSTWKSTSQAARRLLLGALRAQFKPLARRSELPEPLLLPRPLLQDPAPGPTPATPLIHAPSPPDWTRLPSDPPRTFSPPRPRADSQALCPKRLPHWNASANLASSSYGQAPVRHFVKRL